MLGKQDGLIVSLPPSSTSHQAADLSQAGSLDLGSNVIRRVEVALQLDLVTELAVRPDTSRVPSPDWKPTTTCPPGRRTRVTSAKMRARPAGGVWMIEYHSITPANRSSG